MSPRDSEREQEPVTIRDKRRIDPETGAVRDPARSAEQEPPVLPHDAEPSAAEEAELLGSEAGDGTGAPDELDPVQVELAERTADLQRVSAEYANYRRRVDRDRQVVTDGAKAQVAMALLPVLDDLDRAHSHGDLQGPLKSVADKLTDALTGQGLAAFGQVGDAFDPALHEAVAHSGDGGAPVLEVVMRQGYRFGERVLRPAMVAVTEDGVAQAEQAAPDELVSDQAVSDHTVPGPTTDET